MFLTAIIAVIIGGADHCDSGGRLGVWAAMVAAKPGHNFFVIELSDDSDCAAGAAV
jgi:hypothetical protein